MREPRFDILFEPVRIGPVVAKNRFYQVPHCNGMGHRMPRAVAAMRGIKAEGGWGVVCTEMCEIHSSSDVGPYLEMRLWSDADIPSAALMCDAVHAHGALAGVELAHAGISSNNHYSREAPMGPVAEPNDSYAPLQARAMDKQDIADVRRWHRNAALRAKRAGFDIVYVYAGHGLALPMQFLQRRRNTRTDEYGGSLENRARLLRELVEDTKDAVGDKCAIAVRLAVDELMGAEGLTADGEGRAVIEMMAELPDLWDVNISGFSNDAKTSRFAEEGHQESFTAFVKKVTTKPVVGVGRFTSPDAMVSQIKRGILDFIGAARPSIADPFLPKKIEEGRLDDIRECIGCNICVSGDSTFSPIRCTQNPTMGEEWRKGWHPERMNPKKSEDGSVLIVGAGPAGLEAARALGERGYSVHLAEASRELGGRVSLEARLPGLAQWARVRDWRVGQIAKLANVAVYRESRLGVAEVLEFAPDHVIVATGAQWRRDGVGRTHALPVTGFDRPSVITPDQIIAGMMPDDPVAIYDDDHYYIGGVIAEILRRAGRTVTLVTPAPYASAWTAHTLELHSVQTRLMEAGITVLPNRRIMGFDGSSVDLACVFTERTSNVECASIVTISARLPDDAVFRQLLAAPETLAAAGIRRVQAIGDARAPSTIAAAVYSGHQAARELDSNTSVDTSFARELPELVADRAEAVDQDKRAGDASPRIE